MIPVETLSKYAYFSGLTEDALQELAKNLEPFSVKAGDDIIKESTPADYFYFIKDGDLEVTKRTRFGQKATITVLEGGTAFGEMALLTCSHRHSSVSAKTDAQLYRLSKKLFEDIMLADTTFKDKLIKRARCYSAFNKMKTSQPFALIEPEKVYAIAEKMEDMVFPAGHEVIAQGDKGDNYYIIKSGRVEVVRTPKGGGEAEKVAELTVGDSFGEEALIRDERRNATVRTLDETGLLVLSKKDFDSMIKTSFLDFAFPEEIPLDRLNDYVFIDARIRPEYEEAHIEGARNIPLEELRQKYNELDPSQQYLTYCTNDSRGMVAAFLLSSQGFNAKNLRGGLSGWEGPIVEGKAGIYYPEL